MKTLAIIQLLSTAPFAAAGLRGARTLAFSERKVTTFHEVKLTPENVKPPTLGADNASGVATVQLDYNELRPEAKWKICIQADVHGFTPDKLYIKKALIDQSVESAVVDFSGMLSDIDPYFDGCIKVDEIEFNQILENPVRRQNASLSSLLTHINPHVSLTLNPYLPEPLLCRSPHCRGTDCSQRTWRSWSTCPRILRPNQSLF